MSQILGPEVQLNGNIYRLNRKDPLNSTMPQGRNWQVEKVRQTAKREARGYIQQDSIPDELVAVYDDWSHGCTGDHEPMRGKIHLAYDVSTLHPGSLLSVAATQKSLGITKQELCARPFLYSAPARSLIGGIWLFAGRYAYQLNQDGTTQNGLDLGAGVTATDAIMWGYDLYVACGSSGYIKKIYYDVGGGAIAVSTDDTIEANYFTIADDKLWRVYVVDDNPLASCIQPLEDPFTATWSAGITVGNSAGLPTDLSTYGVQLAVSTETGCYLGDSEANFTNIFPFLQSLYHRHNGFNTLVVGDRLYYPCFDGKLFMYSQGAVAEISLGKNLTSFDNSSAETPVPGLKVSALCQGSEGSDLWAVTEPTLDLPCKPDLLRTVDNEVSFTDHTAAVTDGDWSTYASLNTMGGAADGDYFYIGYGSKFYGVAFELLRPSDGSNGSLLQAEFWNGAAWVATSFPANTDLPALMYDGTSGAYYANNHTMMRSGCLYFSVPSDDQWALKTIDSKSRYWVRLSVNGTGPMSDTRISELRVTTGCPQCSVWHLRPATSADASDSIMTWTPVFMSANVNEQLATNLGLITDIKLGYSDGYMDNLVHQVNDAKGALVLASHNYIATKQLPCSSSREGYLRPSAVAGAAISYKDDMGTPDIDKQFLSIVVRGRKVDSNHSLTLWTRLDDAAGWTITNASIIASPTSTSLLSAGTGKSFQWLLWLNGTSGADQDLPTEVNEILVRYRELPTYKHHYTMIIELADNQYASNQEPLPTPDVQLTNLEACLSAGPLTLIDPLGRSKTVTVYSVKELEVAQGHNEYPYLLVEVRAAEV